MKTFHNILSIFHKKYFGTVLIYKGIENENKCSTKKEVLL